MLGKPPPPPLPHQPPGEMLQAFASRHNRPLAFANLRFSANYMDIVTFSVRYERADNGFPVRIPTKTVSGPDTPPDFWRGAQSTGR